MADRARSTEELEATFRDFTDPAYHEPLEREEVAVGWDAVAGAAAVHARASRAIRDNGQAFYILPHSKQSAEPASGARKASGGVLARRTSAAYELRIAAGKALLTRMRDSRGKPAVLPEFVLAGELVLEAGSLGPVDATAIATRAGNQGNVAAGTIVGFLAEGKRSVICEQVAPDRLVDTGAPDVFTAGDVGRYVRLAGETAPRRVLSYSQSGAEGTVSVDGPTLAPGNTVAELLEWAELGVTLEQPADFVTGRHGTLDAIGKERVIPRAPGEDDLAYAYRISDLPDVVSLPALERLAASILSPLGIDFEILETREQIPGFTLDHAPLDAGSICTDSPWSGAVLLTGNATKRFFILCYEQNVNAGSYGLPFDAVNAGVNAFDSGEMPGDGSAVSVANALSTLHAALDAARMAGVAFRIVQHATYEPWQIQVIDLEVLLISDAPPYEDAAIDAVETLLQLAPPSTPFQAWQFEEAIATKLIADGLSPSPVMLTSITTLDPGPHGVLRLGSLAIVGGS